MSSRAAIIALVVSSWGWEARGDDAASLHHMEHGLYMQEIQWDHYGAMLEFQKVLATPNLAPRLATEARFHLAECYEARDCPAAALSLYQTISRQFSELQPYAKQAAARAAEITGRTDDALSYASSSLPCAHGVSHMGDILLLLRSSLRNGDGKLSGELVNLMQDQIFQIEEELHLAPVGESPGKAAQRQAALDRALKQKAALGIITSAMERSEMDVAIRMATSDSSLQTLLDRRTLYPSQVDWGALVAMAKESFVKGVADGDAAKTSKATTDLQSLITPVMEGPGGNPLVQTAQATLQLVMDLQPLVAKSDWPEARRTLATKLTALAHRHHPALHARVPGWETLSPSLLPQMISVLVHADEALDDIRTLQRKETVIQNLDSALTAALKVNGEWQGQPDALARLQRTSSALQQARNTAFAGDLTTAGNILRKETYF